MNDTVTTIKTEARFCGIASKADARHYCKTLEAEQ